MPDLRELLERALPDAWEGAEAPADTAIERGTRIRRRRRATSTVAILGSFLVVLLAAGVIAPWNDDAAPVIPSTTFELPALDSDEFYYWDEDRKAFEAESELLDPYDKALKGFMADEESALLDPGSPVDFARISRQLVHDADADFIGETGGDEVVYRQPAYYSSFDTPIYGPLFVDVIPRGGFTKGSTTDVVWEFDGEYIGPGHVSTHLIACGEFPDSDGSVTAADISAECETTTGPGGQEVVRSVETRDETTGDTRHFGRVVLYRDDGTAVRVRIDNDQPEGELDELLDVMTDLAAALPTDPVR